MPIAADTATHGGAPLWTVEAVTTEWRPVLAPSVLLRHDNARDAELLVMPERVVRLKGPAAAILSLCDGSRTEADIVTELSTRFPGAPVAGEVPPFLARVRAQGWLR